MYIHIHIYMYPHTHIHTLRIHIHNHNHATAPGVSGLHTHLVCRHWPEGIGWTSGLKAMASAVVLFKADVFPRASCLKAWAFLKSSALAVVWFKCWRLSLALCRLNFQSGRPGRAWYNRWVIAQSLVILIDFVSTCLFVTTVWEDLCHDGTSEHSISGNHQHGPIPFSPCRFGVARPCCHTASCMACGFDAAARPIVLMQRCSAAQFCIYIYVCTYIYI